MISFASVMRLPPFGPDRDPVPVLNSQPGPLHILVPFIRAVIAYRDLQHRIVHPVSSLLYPVSCDMLTMEAVP